MRVLFLTNMYPPYDIGGYEQICQEVAEGLKNRGHSVKILTSRYGVEASSNGEEDVIRSLYLQADLNYYRPADFFLRWPAQEKFNLFQLQSVVESFTPDVVVIWGMYLLSLNLPYWLERWMPAQVVYYIASYWPTDEDPHRIYWRLTARRWIAEQFKRPLRSLAFSKLKMDQYPPSLKFSRTLCCSEYVKSRLVMAGAIPPESGVLHIGIDPAPFFTSAKLSQLSGVKPLRMLYFGRLIEDKGVHTAIQALNILKTQDLANHVQLTVLGSGHPEYEARLHSMVSESGLGDQVKFAGKISRDAVPAVLSQFDVFLFTSIWPEPFGRTIIEAMLANLIVIGSDVGGSREIFAEYDSDLLYPAGDAGALASRIALLLSGSKDTGELIRRGKALALGKFSLDNMVAGIETYLLNVIRSNFSKVA